MTGEPSRRVGVVRLPDLLPYEAGLDWQRKLARARIDGRLSTDLPLLLQHAPVMTLGRGATASASGTGSPAGNVSLSRSEIPQFEVERGGDITYHGPGQIVGYPILDLEGFRKDLHWYVRTLEEALILALAPLGARGFRVGDHTGVWVGEGRGLDRQGRRDRTGDETGASADVVRDRIAAGSLRKIASIGVHVSRWVTWHGFALNVSEAALGPFSAIVPCGIPGVSMTSLESEGLAVSWEDVVAKVESGFGRAFEARMEEFGQGELERLGLALELGGPDLRPAPAVADHG
ncbi:MAG: lipoyl(octanoyl) transferase LipB [Gemmatimonadota bacterium]